MALRLVVAAFFALSLTACLPAPEKPEEPPAPVEPGPAPVDVIDAPIEVEPAAVVIPG